MSDELFPDLTDREKRILIQIYAAVEAHMRRYGESPPDESLYGFVQYAIYHGTTIDSRLQNLTMKEFDEAYKKFVNKGILKESEVDKFDVGE